MTQFESIPNVVAPTAEQIKSDIEEAITILKQRLGSSFRSDNPLLSERVLEVIADKYNLDITSIFNTSGDEKAEIEGQKVGKLMDVYTTDLIDDAMQKHLEAH